MKKNEIIRKNRRNKQRSKIRDKQKRRIYIAKQLNFIKKLMHYAKFHVARE